MASDSNEDNTVPTSFGLNVTENTKHKEVGIKS